jgi:hypothetical protein
MRAQAMPGEDPMTLPGADESRRRSFRLPGPKSARPEGCGTCRRSTGVTELPRSPIFTFRLLNFAPLIAFVIARALTFRILKMKSSISGGGNFWSPRESVRKTQARKTYQSHCQKSRRTVDPYLEEVGKAVDFMRSRRFTMRNLFATKFWPKIRITPRRTTLSVS